MRYYLKKKPNTKQGWWSSSRCRPLVQTPVLQKKKKRTEKAMPRMVRATTVKTRLCKDTHAAVSTVCPGQE
jgi:hypothetical protein